MPERLPAELTVDDRLRGLERAAADGTDEDRLHWFLALHRSGSRVPVYILHKQVEGTRYQPKVDMMIEAISQPVARVPVELVLLMNIGDKHRPLESFRGWTGRFTFRFTEDSDEGPAKLQLEAMRPNGPRIEGCKVFNVWTGQKVYVTWHKQEDGLPNDVPWLIDVQPVFDPARVRA